MDAFLYTAASAADASQRALAVRANNLANAHTTGFRADRVVAEPLAVAGHGHASRWQTAVTVTAVDPREGRLAETGRPLDVAVQGEGYFVVATDDGPAYSRAGGFMLDAQGTLMLDGRAVQGDGGAIVLPPHDRLDIADDGSLSVMAPGAREMEVVERLRLVRVEATDLVKRADGLLASRAGVDYPRDDQVRVAAGHLEQSNVSAIEEMMQTLQLSRGFEMQMRLFRSADEMADAGNRLVRG